jgi:hypothetical protein
MQNRNGSNNSGTLKKFKEFFPHSDNGFEPPDLNAMYQSAASCQTRASQRPQLALAN